MAGLDIAERRIPQDGGIHVVMDKKPIDLRVSTMPGKAGEKVVMWYISGNRDETVVENPNAYVIDRDARKVFVFANRLLVSAEKGAEASGLFLAAPGPNPVRGETTLRFALRESGPAVLAVYDALGREVARLVDGLSAVGEQSVSFDASALAPGLYLVRLDANGASTSQTLVRIR